MTAEPDPAPDPAPDPSEFDGPWVEPCGTCWATGAVKHDLYFVAVCPDCGGSCYVEHDHQPA